MELDHNESSDVYNNRGIAKYNLGQHEEAIKDYNKVIELNPNESAAYNNRGAAKKNLGQYEDALRDCKKALELCPNDNLFKRNIENIQNQYDLK